MALYSYLSAVWRIEILSYLNFLSMSKIIFGWFTRTKKAWKSIRFSRSHRPSQCPIPEEKQPNSTPNMQTGSMRVTHENRNYTSRGHSLMVARSVQKVAKFLGVANNVNKRLYFMSYIHPMWETFPSGVGACLSGICTYARIIPNKRHKITAKFSNLQIFIQKKHKNLHF